MTLARIAVCLATCFYDLGLSRLGFEHPTFRGERSNPLRHRHGFRGSIEVYGLKLYKQREIL